MRIAAFPAGELQTNCYVVSSDTESDCIIIDPGQNAFLKIKRIVDENQLHPLAVFLTHGHADHTWNAPEVASAFGIPVFAAKPDHFMVIDPLAGVGPLLASMFHSILGNHLLICGTILLQPLITLICPSEFFHFLDILRGE